MHIKPSLVGCSIDEIVRQLMLYTMYALSYLNSEIRKYSYPFYKFNYVSFEKKDSVAVLFPGVP